MKISSIAVAVATFALAATSDAANSLIRAYNQEGFKGACNSFPVLQYNACYIASDFHLLRSASYTNEDSNNNKITVIFFETGNCGGKWSRASGTYPKGITQLWGALGPVGGKVGSIIVQNVLTNGPASGTIDQYLPATRAKWTNKC
ncbi:hypothetical protein BGW38_002785 [Lunasporangiospora selenospora]|uniref:Uncharacterized protein n=1 Tax=Lunasporangiospora selenospora TaxID=979761 RepID=A0A9P6KD50_9FUNG|nr:hypothetical protein BGW38_002785 [Lunasporangiospora selenospora]